jgi:hypothetical protein
MKPAGTMVQGAISWLLRLLFLGIPFRGLGLTLVLDHSDVSRLPPQRDVPSGRLSQLLELTFLSTTLEGAAPRRREIALGHGLSLEAGVATGTEFPSVDR